MACVNNAPPPPSPQDVADFEWVMWFTTFRSHILFALAGHVIFAKILTLVASKVRAKALKPAFEHRYNGTSVCLSFLSRSVSPRAPVGPVWVVRLI